jgi:hypothetical protein
MLKVNGHIEEIRKSRLFQQLTHFFCSVFRIIGVSLNRQTRPIYFADKQSLDRIQLTIQSQGTQSDRFHRKNLRFLKVKLTIPLN